MATSTSAQNLSENNVKPPNSPNPQSSPRNASSSSQNSVAVHVGSLEVAKSLQEGEKCVKWDEVRIFSFLIIFYQI